MKKIGIITCGNTARHGKCLASGCLHALNEGLDTFSRYNPEEVELAGIAQCSGCPTLLAPEAILETVRPFLKLNIDALHFTSCMTKLCPFIQKYLSIISAQYPDITVVEGTHAATPDFVQSFATGMKNILTDPRENIFDYLPAPE